MLRESSTIFPDPTVWAHIESREWGPVSARMTPIKAHYEGDIFVLDEWTWDDVAFVPAGAFPNARREIHMHWGPATLWLRGSEAMRLLMRSRRCSG